MRSISTTVVFVLLLTSSHVAIAQETKTTGAAGANSGSDAIAAIPSEAVAFLSVPSVSVLDRDYQQVIGSLGLAPFFQPPMNSLLGMLQAYLPNLAGFDPDGSLSLVVLPFTSPLEVQMKTVLLLPAKDPKKLLESLGGQSVADGMWMLTLGGISPHAIVRDQHVVLGILPDVLKSVEKSKDSIAKTLAPGDLEVLNDLHIRLWMQAGPILGLFKQQLDNAFETLGEGVEAQYQQQQADLWVKGTKSIAFGLAFDDRGFLARGGMTFNPGSALAKQMVGNNTSSLLRGLPASKYIIASGQTVSREQISGSLEVFDPLVEQIPAEAGNASENAAALRKEVIDWLSLTTPSTIHRRAASRWK